MSRASERGRVATSGYAPVDGSQVAPNVAYPSDAINARAIEFFDNVGPSFWWILLRILRGHYHSS